MNPKHQKLTKVAVYGAALSTIYAAPALQASIIPISFSVGSVVDGASLQNVQLSASGVIGALEIDNVSTWGKNFYGEAQIEFVQIVQTSQTLAAGTLTGRNVVNSFSATGTQIIGFETADERVGYFRVNLGGPGGPIQFLDSAFGTANETVHVAAAAATVPAPATLGLAALALGALGVQRRRKYCAEKAAA